MRFFYIRSFLPHTPYKNAVRLTIISVCWTATRIAEKYAVAKSAIKLGTTPVVPKITNIIERTFGNAAAQ